MHSQRLKIKVNSNGIPIFSPKFHSHIHRITNDAREGEMEENMGQVNTMIGNVFLYFRYTAKLIYKKNEIFFPPIG